MPGDFILAGLLPPAKYSVREILGPYGWVVVVSFFAAAISTLICRAAARHWGIVDKPDGFLKPHRRPIAYLGGVAIFVGWVAGMLTIGPFAVHGRDWLVGLMAAGGVVLILGLADDILSIRPIFKLLGQVIAAAILLCSGIGQRIVVIALPAWLACPEWLVLPLSIPVTVLLVVAACNAANLLDGIDGLCSGVTGIISLSFLILATHLAMYGYSESHDQVRIVASLAMFGAVCGFLPYNSSPATIFLGDAGSMLLGLYAAAMMLMFGERGIARWVMGAVMIFGLPILDTFMALVRRLRLGRRIFAGDRSHFYDQLIDRGFSVKQTLAICYGLAAFYGIVGLSIILIRARYGVIIYVLVAGLTLYMCHRLGFLKPPIDSPRERAYAAGRAESAAHSRPAEQNDGRAGT